MSAGTFTLADLVLRRERGRPSAWAGLLGRQGVRRALMRTSSADSIVTDSAAAGSAWGSGRHVHNNVINITPDGVEHTPILVQARQNAKRVGLVTTTRVTHATPASFIANTPSRNLEDQIARQIIERGVDVCLGGGAKHFPEAALQAAGVRTVRDADALAGAAVGGRLLGLFHESHCRYVLDRQSGDPSLSAMTQAALRHLGDGPDGFVLQVEGGRVDHAAHANDAPSLVAEQIDFDDALETVLRFIEGRDDTLLIVTTDHANANPGLTLYGQEGERCLQRLRRAKRSFEWIFEQLQTRLASDDPVDTSRFKREAEIPAIVREATGVELEAWETELFTNALRGRARQPFAPMSAPACVLGACLANRFGVSFVSPNHTADDVEVTALGPGSEELGGMIDNIELHALMVRAMDLAPVGAG